SPFFKAFLVTADVPEIYMQEFWATAYVHQLSIRFKMDTRKNIVDLEAFRVMLHISPRVPGQSVDEPPFEEEILDFLRFLGHSSQIKTLSDVNVNKLFQLWRSFTAVINKCLTGKSSVFDSFREHKKQKKSNEMYYPRFTKVIIHHFMTKKPSIPRRNKVNWHYVRDDIMFSTIKVVSRHQNTQQYGAILPIELTNKDIRNTKAYKEYYACATGEAAPKPKASARRKRCGFDSSTTPPTAVASLRPITTVAATPRLTAAAKGKQPARATSPQDPSEVEITEAEQLKIVLRRSRQETHISQHGGSGTDEGTGSKPGLDEQEDTESGEGDVEETESDEENVKEETREEEEESFDPIPRIPEDSEDDGNEEEADELYHDVDINQGRRLQVSQYIEDSHVTLTPVQPDGQQESSSVSSFVTSMLNPISDAGLESIFTTASSPITPIQTSTPIMTPSTVATITTSIVLKRRRGDDDDQEGPFAGSDRGSKRRKEGGEPESARTLSEPTTRSAGRSTLNLDRCQPPRKPLTLDHDWNKTLPAIQGSAQTWISELAKQVDSRSSFNELLDTPIDFSNFIMNRLGVDTLTPELLAGPTYKLMRGSCNSLTELEYHLEEVCKATTDQLDWINPEDYGHIKWIEDLVPHTKWIQEPLNYDKHALWGVSHWGPKRQQFYGFVVNQESALDVYSKRRIIAVTDLKIVEWHNYKHLDWISVRRDDDKIYKFKEGDFKRLRLQDIEDMLLLLV
nr:hypothetical protein [Tanacetum cinerariifolium]